MEKYHYEPVDTNKTESNKVENPSWILFFRQLLICSVPWTTLFISGLGLGSTTVLVVQWRKEAKSEDAITEEMSSWLTCGGFYLAPLWSIFWTVLTKYIGRKIPLGLAYIITLMGFILFYYSTTTTHLLISEVLKSSGYACNLSVSVLILTEYSSPQYRGFFMTVKAASVMWGMWVANAIGAFFHWRYISLSSFICFAYCGTIVFWPESPLWLATQGRFEECATSHRWLKGTGEDSEKELKNLIETQKENLRNAQKNPIMVQFVDFLKIAKQKHFYKPLFLATFVSFQILFSGKLTTSLYAMEIIKKMTNDESSAYTIMLILDGATVFSMYCGCFVCRFVKRRTQFICASVVAIFFLFSISLYYHLISLNILVENDVVIATLLTAFSIGISCGPFVLCFTIYGELMPMESRTTYTITYLMMHFVLAATYVKTAPYVFNRLSMSLTFLIYAVTATMNTIFFYLYLPETKDKTIAEIENMFRDDKPAKKDGHIEDVE